MILLTASLSIPSLKAEYVWAVKLWVWAVMLLVILCGRPIAYWLVWTFVFILRKSFPLLRVRAPPQRPKLRMARPSSPRLVPHLPSPSVSPPEGDLSDLARSHRVPDRHHDLARQDHLRQVSRLLVPRQHLLRSDEGERVPSLRPRRALRRSDGRRGGGGGGEGRGDRHVAMSRLKRLSRATSTAFDVGRLVRHVIRTGLTTVSRTTDRVGVQFREAEAEITSEWEARRTAERVFRNAARPGNK